MKQTLSVRNEIIIQAPGAKVWDALVNPSQTKKYMFGCEAISDWKPGSELLWKGRFNGVEMIAVKGKIISIIPGIFLEYTTIDPHSEVPDLPENYLTVTYRLSEKAGETALTVEQGDYNLVADGEKRYQDTVNGGGWASILVEIKKLAEGS
jgi:uncharacterized protein YndB with AHSA1/START domain